MVENQTNGNSGLGAVCTHAGIQFFAVGFPRLSIDNERRQPFFQFVAPRLPTVGSYFEVLEEMVPSFLISGLVGISVSLWDKQGQAYASEIGTELEEASGRKPIDKASFGHTR